jgi:hypothetical protein
MLPDYCFIVIVSTLNRQISGAKTAFAIPKNEYRVQEKIKHQQNFLRILSPYLQLTKYTMDWKSIGLKAID